MEAKTRKPKQPTWANFEVLTFINVKKLKHKANFEIINSKYNMETMGTNFGCYMQVGSKTFTISSNLQRQMGIFVWRL
jgi:hypothetical protein